MKSIHHFLLPFFLAATAGCGGPAEEPDDAMRLVPVEAIALERAEGYPVERRFVGTVEAKRRSRLAFELGGTIESVFFDEGDPVEAGEILARIDTSRLEARRRELLATLDQAEATRKLARSTLERFETLAEAQSVSVQEVENARERLLNAEANLVRIEAQLDSVGVDLAKSVLTAPYGGTLSFRGVDEGAVASPKEPVFELLETGRLEVRAAVTPGVAAGLVPGDSLRVRLDGGAERDFTVRRILPQRDDRTRTVDVILEAPSDLDGIRDGDLVVAASVHTIRERGFFLPRDALTESVRGLWACFVLVPDPGAGPEAHRLDRRDIEVLHAWADTVYARGPLDQGERVLATGLQKVAPGQRVRVVSEREAPPLPDIASGDASPFPVQPEPAAE